jgi:O-methyltransferase
MRGSPTAPPVDREPDPGPLRTTVRRKATTVRARAKTLALLSLARTNHYIATGPVFPYHRLRRGTANTEFVRAATTELLAREIGQQGLPGAVAELGVYRGGYASTLAACFPGRLLHLFDTFEGFDARDVEADVAAGLPGTPYPLPPVAADIVQSLVRRHPERLRIHAGWFPESAAGVEDERFCFVHIDVGLYAATATGLDWFHPRLVPGGYILVADYNNAHTPGVRLAVREFLARTGAAYTVLPDFQGHAIVAKPRPRRPGTS